MLFSHHSAEVQHYHQASAVFTTQGALQSPQHSNQPFFRVYSGHHPELWPFFSEEMPLMSQWQWLLVTHNFQSFTLYKAYCRFASHQSLLFPSFTWKNQSSLCYLTARVKKNNDQKEKMGSSWYRIIPRVPRSFAPSGQKPHSRALENSLHYSTDSLSYCHQSLELCIQWEVCHFIPLRTTGKWICWRQATWQGWETPLRNHLISAQFAQGDRVTKWALGGLY